jgi:hypothetical protein
VGKGFATIRGVAAALVIVSAGCGGGKTRGNDGPPPVEETPAEGQPTPPPPSEGGAGALKHESLQEVVNEVSSARQGGADGTQPVDFGAISGAAQKIQDGAGEILNDAPGTLRDEDRVRYEGLIAQVKERAADLKLAAEARDKSRTDRSFLQLQSSCVRCHHQFGSPAGGAGNGR